MVLPSLTSVMTGMGPCRLFLPQSGREMKEIVVEHFELFVPVGELDLEEVAERDDAKELLPADDRKMAAVGRLHFPETRFLRLALLGHDEVARHDPFHRDPGGLEPFGDDAR